MDNLKRIFKENLFTWIIAGFLILNVTMYLPLMIKMSNEITMSTETFVLMLGVLFGTAFLISFSTIYGISFKNGKSYYDKGLLSAAIVLLMIVGLGSLAYLIYKNPNNDTVGLLIIGQLLFTTMQGAIGSIIIKKCHERGIYDEQTKIKEKEGRQSIPLTYPNQVSCLDCAIEEAIQQEQKQEPIKETNQGILLKDFSSQEENLKIVS